jgi:hypothetical protein
VQGGGVLQQVLPEGAKFMDVFLVLHVKRA